MKIKKKPTFILRILAVILSIAILPIGVLTVSASSLGDSEDAPYLITNASELVQFATDVNNGVSTLKKYYKLTADIDISSYDNWTPIGSKEHAFIGSFDGDNHTINGLTIAHTASAEDKGYFNIGLFGSVGAAYGYTQGTTCLKNIKLTNVSINCQGGGLVYAGGLVGGASYTAIDNCSSSFASGKSVQAPNAGGLIGVISGGSCTNLSNSSDVIGNGIYTSCAQSTAGGIAGMVQNCNFNNVSNSGMIKMSTSGNGPYLDWCVGGVIGYCSAFGSPLTGVSNSGSVSGPYNVGGIVGSTQVNDGGDYFSISQSFNIGKITSSGTNAGGIVGYSSRISIDQCFNYGAINSGGRAGGITAYCLNVGISNCYNTESINGGADVGGICGYMMDSNSSLNQSYNTGFVHSTYKYDNFSFVGSVVGAFDGKSTTNNFFALGINPELDSAVRPGYGRANSVLICKPLTVQQMTNDSVLDSANDAGLMSTLGSKWVKRTTDTAIYYPELKFFYTSSNSDTRATSRQSVMATIPPTYGFSINPSTDGNFPKTSSGYSSVDPYTVEVKNTGTGDTGNITVGMYPMGTYDFSGSFKLSKTAIDSISEGGSDSFSITPLPGLTAGTYKLNVIVVSEKRFINPFYYNVTLTLTVGDEPTVKGGPRTIDLCGIPGGGTPKLYRDDDTIVNITPTKNPDGTYTYKDLEPGTYYATKTVEDTESGPSNKVTVSDVIPETPETPSAPALTGGKRTITVKDVTEGATLKLYKADGTIVTATPTQNEDGTYSYTDVEPGTYYVTQTVGDTESGNSNTATVSDVTPETPLAPTLTGGTRTITVKDVTEGATLKLYKADGTIVTATPTQNEDGTYAYTDVEPGTYYVTETVGDTESGNSNTATVSDVTPETPSAPTLTGGTRTITVKDVTEGATLKLYKADGTIVTATPTQNADGTYSYTDVEPGTYYVTQTVGDTESGNSNTATVSDVIPETPETPSAPTLTGGTRTITVKDVIKGATLKLYKADGTIVTAIPTQNADGTYSYTDVEPGTYYVTQTVEDTESGNSSTVTVTGETHQAPNAPTLTGGKRTITVKDVTKGATLKLYKADGTIVIAIPTKNPDGSYTYMDLKPGDYYVTQTVNGSESGHSSTFSIAENAAISNKLPKTGDSTSVALLIGLLSLSLLIISVMLKRRKQNS